MRGGEKVQIAKVIVDVPLMQTDKPYSYAVPKEFSTMLEVGMRVHVPFWESQSLDSRDCRRADRRNDTRIERDCRGFGLYASFK